MIPLKKVESVYRELKVHFDPFLPGLPYLCTVFYIIQEIHPNEFKYQFGNHATNFKDIKDTIRNKIKGTRTLGQTDIAVVLTVFR